MSDATIGNVTITASQISRSGMGQVEVRVGDVLVHTDRFRLGRAESRKDFIKAIRDRLPTLDEDCAQAIDKEILFILDTHSDERDTASSPDSEGAAETLTPMEGMRARDREADEALGELPEIPTNARQFRHVVRDAWDAVLAQGSSNMPAVFVRDGNPVSVVGRSAGPAISVVTNDNMSARLARVADWTRVTSERSVAVPPPVRVAKDMVEIPDAGLQPLEAIVSSPIVSGDGSLLTAAGYYPDDRVILHEPLEVGPLPKAPTSADVAKARRLIDQELLIDFPFAAESDRTHAVSAAITPLVRRMMPESTSPFFSFEASTPGSGKGVLAQSVITPSCGPGMRMRAFPKNEEELHKYFTSALIEAPPVVVFDNAAQGRQINSPELAAMLTTPVWNDRVLGVSKVVNCPNQTLWMMTGNNPRFSMEIARRTVRVRLDPRQERPWERDGFRHTLPQWAYQHRAELLHALLIFVRNWVCLGQPKASIELGSFERWSQVVGGIVTAAGYEGFLADREEVYATADAEASEYRSFVLAWWEAYGGAPQATATLLGLCRERELLADVLGDGSDRSQSTRFGRALSAQRQRVYAGLRIELAKDCGHRGKQHQLVPVEQPEDEAGDVGNVEGTSEDQRPPLSSDAAAETYDNSGDVGDVDPGSERDGDANPAGGPDQDPPGEVCSRDSQEAIQGPPRPPDSANHGDGGTYDGGPQGQNVPTTSPDVPPAGAAEPAGVDPAEAAARQRLAQAIETGNDALVGIAAMDLEHLVGRPRTRVIEDELRAASRGSST